MLWRLLIPIKHPATAKTRLHGATRRHADHAELVRAIQSDTVEAALAARSTGGERASSIAGVFIVGDRPPPGLAPLGETDLGLLPDSGSGLNASLRAAAAALSARYPADGVAAMVADLPALRPAALNQALAAATLLERGYVADAAGTGTTVLTARAGQPLTPEFGLDSARRHHASGAIEIDADLSLRSDVDTAEDLRRCLLLGVGEHTARMVARLV